MIYFEIGFIIIFGLLINNISDKTIGYDRKKTVYIVCCLTLFWLMAALRNIDWASSLHLDAGGYASSFHLYQSMSWSTLFGSFLQRYLYQIGDADIGYYILNKLIGFFTNDYNVFSLIVDLLFFIPFGLLLYKYNKTIRQNMVAFIFYVALIQVHLLSGARQMLAIGLDILAIMFAIDNKRIKAIILLILGVTIHFSSLLTAAPMVLIFIDFKPIILKRIHFLSILAFPLIFMFPNQVISFLAYLVGSDRYASYGANSVQGGASTFIILIAALSVFCYFAITINNIEENSAIRKLYTVTPFFTLFGPLIHSNGSMIRICLYFYIYLTILIPYGLDRIFSKNSQTLAYTITIVVLVFLIIKGGTMDYHFMWQSF